MGPTILEPGVRDLVGGRAPHAPRSGSAFNPWDRITTPEAVRTLLHDGGAENIDVVPEAGYQALRTPEDFWTMARGSGLRWTIDQMGTELAREVKREILDRLAAAGVDRVETNVIYAIAEKPPVNGRGDR